MLEKHATSSHKIGMANGLFKPPGLNKICRNDNQGWIVDTGHSSFHTHGYNSAYEGYEEGSSTYTLHSPFSGGTIWTEVAHDLGKYIYS